MLCSSVVLVDGFSSTSRYTTACLNSLLQNIQPLMNSTFLICPWDQYCWEMNIFPASWHNHGIFVHLLRFHRLFSNLSQICFILKFWDRAQLSIDGCCMDGKIKNFFCHMTSIYPVIVSSMETSSLYHRKLFFFNCQYYQYNNIYVYWLFKFLALVFAQI